MTKIIAQNGKNLWFMCPGCRSLHHVVYGSGQKDWTWNGNADAPTLHPSILVTGGHYDEDFKAGDACWCTYNALHPEQIPIFFCQRCHSYVTDGKIQFLADCSHALAGQTVDLPDIASNAV
jgi:hypothetical protein